MSYYNEQRYPCEHFGITPQEVLDGEQPNKNRFKAQIKEARKIRILQNQAFNKCPLSVC